MAESDIVAVAIVRCISIYQNSVISLYHHFTNPSNRLVPMLLLKLPIMLCSNAPELCLLCSPYVNYYALQIQHFVSYLQNHVLAIFAYNAGIMLIAFSFLLCSNYDGIIGSILYSTVTALCKLVLVLQPSSTN